MTKGVSRSVVGHVSHSGTRTRGQKSPTTDLVGHGRVDPERAHVVDEAVDDALRGGLGGAHLVVPDAAKDAVASALGRPADNRPEALRDRVGRVGRTVQFVVGDLRVRHRCTRVFPEPYPAQSRQRSSVALAKTRSGGPPLGTGRGQKKSPRAGRERTFEPSSDTAAALPAPARAAPPRTPCDGRRRAGRQPLPERNIPHLYRRLVHVDRRDRFLLPRRRRRRGPPMSRGGRGSRGGSVARVGVVCRVMPSGRSRARSLFRRELARLSADAVSSGGGGEQRATHPSASFHLSLSPFPCLDDRVSVLTCLLPWRTGSAGWW